MLYRRKLELDIEEIRPELNIVRTASQELKSSPKFKQVLQVRHWMFVMKILRSHCSGRSIRRQRSKQLYIPGWGNWLPARCVDEGKNNT
jgi:hypothetical protein